MKAKLFLFFVITSASLFGIASALGDEIERDIPTSQLVNANFKKDTFDTGKVIAIYSMLFIISVASYLVLKKKGGVSNLLHTSNQHLITLVAAKRLAPGSTVYVIEIKNVYYLISHTGHILPINLDETKSDLP